MTQTAAQGLRVPLTTYDVVTINQGPALLLIGVLAMLLAAAVVLRNPAALVAWAFALIMVVFSGILDIGFEFVWLAVLVTTVLIAVGAVMRWI